MKVGYVHFGTNRGLECGVEYQNEWQDKKRDAQRKGEHAEQIIFTYVCRIHEQISKGFIH